MTTDTPAGTPASASATDRGPLCAALAAADGLVDATPVGLSHHPGTNDSGLAVMQAVESFELLTGRTAHPDRMRATFLHTADTRGC